VTTIAWDGKRFLAADRGVTISGYKAEEDKIYTIVIDRETRLLPGISKGDQAYVTGAGLCGPIALYVEWLEDGKIEDMPELKKCEMLIVTSKVALRVDDSGYGVPIKGPQGMGSGGDVATGCMLMGASPEHAVQLASKHLSPELSFGGWTQHDRRDLKA
jgi:hypothetical protein